MKVERNQVRNKEMTKMKIERRNYNLIELRSDDTEKRKMVGHAAIFNSETNIGDFFVERVAPGAFAESIMKDDIRALFNHNPNYVLGRSNSKTKTLRLGEDEKGLAIEIDPPDTQFAKDLTISMERGDIDQMSFGFRVIKESWESRENGLDVRTLEKVKLYDISPVTFPAYEDTEIAVRSHDEWKAQKELDNKPSFEQWRINIERLKLQLKSKEE